MEDLQKIREAKVAFWYKVWPSDKALFYEHLSNLVDWWVTVTNALYGFIWKAINPKMVQEIANLLLFIESWDSFSVAMKKMPYVFDNREIAVIEAWESSWTLQKSFAWLAKQLREQEEIKQKIKSAMTYPIIIMVFLIIAIVVIMAYVMPKLLPLFTESQIELPLSTRMLIATSEFIRSNLIAIFVWITAFIFWITAFAKTDSWKRVFDEMFLKAPLIWNIYKNYIISQFSSNLWLLIWAWIPIIKTLRLAWESSNNTIYTSAVNMISDKVASWKRLTESFYETDPEYRYFPNDFNQMISAWEKTSTINKVCEKISVQYSKEVDNSVSILIKWIEPAAMFFAWLFVLWFALSIFSAIMQITQTIG